MVYEEFQRKKVKNFFVKMKRLLTGLLERADSLMIKDVITIVRCSVNDSSFIPCTHTFRVWWSSSHSACSFTKKTRSVKRNKF